MKTEKPVEEVKKDLTQPKLPKGIKIVGMYKLKDNGDRGLVSFMVSPQVEGIIIQKVKGKNNKIIVAVKVYDTPEPELVPAKENKTNDKPKKA